MSTLVNLLPSLNSSSIALLAASLFVLVHIVPYLLDPHDIRGFPGPFVAKFSDIWLGVVAKNGHRSEAVHKMHQKYGPFIRIAPNHISIAEPDALGIVYAHGNGALKSQFYDAFVSIQRGLFNTRDRSDHTRKRKIVAHIFSQRSVIEFEPQLLRYVKQLLDRWDNLYSRALKGQSGSDGEGWHGRDGRVWLDCLPWANYLAFDIIGDLAFGAPFGMIEAGKDSAPVPKSQDDVMKSYGNDNVTYETQSIPAVQILNGRGEFSMSMGVLPAYWRPLVKLLPWYRRGGKDVKTLAGIAIMAVAKRLATPTDRNDLLSKLQAGKDEQGNPMGRGELTAEALTLLIAGSDTTSNSTCAILYHLARNRQAQQTLQKELDGIMGGEITMDSVKNLPYLDACINEALRIHPTSAIGLPRIVPAGGFSVLGQFFPEGTILSVPSYSIHRDPVVWGEDVETYRPERWFERDQVAIQKTFNPFSFGPRACVGRNLAYLELQIIIASIMGRFDFVLEDPDQPLDTREGFLRKPLACRVGIKRRDGV